VLGRLRDRVPTRLVLKPWGKGLPALNAARVACGLSPVDSVVDAFGRVDRLLVLSPRALDYPGRRWWHGTSSSPAPESP
jgi:hypothetical protein